MSSELRATAFLFLSSRILLHFSIRAFPMSVNSSNGSRSSLILPAVVGRGGGGFLVREIRVIDTPAVTFITNISKFNPIMRKPMVYNSLIFDWFTPTSMHSMPFEVFGSLTIPSLMFYHQCGERRACLLRHSQLDG